MSPLIYLILLIATFIILSFATFDVCISQNSTFQISHLISTTSQKSFVTHYWHLFNGVPFNFRRFLEMDQERERVCSAYEGLRVHHPAPPP